MAQLFRYFWAVMTTSYSPGAGLLHRQAVIMRLRIWQEYVFLSMSVTPVQPTTGGIRRYCLSPHCWHFTLSVTARCLIALSKHAAIIRPCFSLIPPNTECVFFCNIRPNIFGASLHRSLPPLPTPLTAALLTILAAALCKCTDVSE